MLNSQPTIRNIEEASLRIRGLAHITPVMHSIGINTITGSEIYFKCENLQKTGSFKIRGASNAILSLIESKAVSMVATHSSGNFAGALAFAASRCGIKSTIVMPSNSPAAKKAAVAGYGGIIVECEPNLKAREDTLNSIIESTGADFLHPYNDWDVIAGQGTATIELLADIPEPDIIMAPIGGGGLISGTAIAGKSIYKNLNIFAAEPMGADDAFRSIAEGRIMPSVNPNTIADGLLTSLGSKTFPIINKFVDRIILVSENSIVKAMKLIWERMKLIVEPSAAVPLGAVLEYPDLFINKRIGIILSGGNLDLNKLPWQ